MNNRIRSKRDLLEELLGSYLISSEDEKKKILEAFGYEVAEVKYLHVSSGGDYVGNSKDDVLSDLVNFADFDEAALDCVYDKLKDDFDWFFLFE